MPKVYLFTTCILIGVASQSTNALCEAGRYSDTYSSDAVCKKCPPGTVPDLGICFLGTEYESSISNGSTVHNYYVRQMDGSCYLFAQNSVYWTSAERDCYRLGGHLVVYNGQNEANAVASTFAFDFSISDFWIGLNERGNEKAFDWTNKKQCSDYRNWQTTSTSDGSETREPTEDIELESYRCVRSDSNAKLYDENCRSTRRYVCEAPIFQGARSCSECRIGYYAKSGDLECSTCDFGEYTDQKGSSSCDTCPTMSPARLLANQFGKDGSFQCGGSLGKKQRFAYIFVSVLAGVAPIPMAILTWLMSFRLSRPFAATGLACWPNSNENLRSAVGFTAAIISCLTTATAGGLLSTWLKPLKQESTDWPYKGRRTPSTRAKGCDPGERESIFLGALACLVLIGICFLAVFPIPNLFECYRRILRYMTRKRLTRQFQQQTIKFRKERERQERLLEASGCSNYTRDAEIGLIVASSTTREEQKQQQRPWYSFVCTLCGQQRANALNIPCSHQFFCIDCANTFRQEMGAICNACREPSEIHNILIRGHSISSFRTVQSESHREDNDEIVSSRRGQAALFGTFQRSLSAIEMEMVNFKTTDASIYELTRAVAAAKRVRADVQLQFLASTCGGCTQVKSLVVDVPCGHATLCATCAETFRTNHGNICSRCAAESSIQQTVNELSCSVCFDIVPANYLVALGSCGHILCTACTIRYIRSALANVADQVTASGIRCPLGGLVSGHSNACPGVVTRDIVERLVTRNVRPDLRDDVLPLSAEEYERLQRFMYEASISKDERFNCCYANCSRLFAVPFRDLLVERGAAGALGPEVESFRRGTDRIINNLRNVSLPWRLNRSRRFNRAGHNIDDSATSDSDDENTNTNIDQNQDRVTRRTVSFRGDPPYVTCPYCDRQSCVRCKVPVHTLLTCEEVQTGSSALATNAFVLATSKACPQCHFRITHYHGHACHHIRPGTGCPNCGTHFCYTCLRRGTSGSSCGCRLFCSNAQILANIDRLPYPHDRRCGCPICGDCQRGRPCPQCNGGCVVCLGIVEPGPKDAREVALWTTTASVVEGNEENDT
mmetsp:Transcript_19508/g.29648  ORF Transcript_19508/g.29648 Transcript_19508/m.29648 type:complete len:1070 (+) Transcript_19508:75-3284(+)|eukprot:CAMPEP_0197316456 /NCGR_PEP_ID=MMETSP0891-20130614/42780_1 /TAXON_ID=44058 ORGANISM="Aureoumbra lagunensis, Strain CCMP1510" /NCGR_SAMPLE_ID=MMETSP0891 /ASSEMBLY_ACC=CAM_ASM_000534 /LENGTH=1069 /DNA_ID=CAMNT_0042805927 /DNA_START=18 /DNA_END=3227 /DNA_ORIENTATION=-